MNTMQIAALVLVAVGTLLIVLGAYISLKDWQAKRAPSSPAASAVSESLDGLAKLADALKSYPLGQQLVVWGIVVLIVAGVFGGVSGLTK